VIEIHNYNHTFHNGSKVTINNYQRNLANQSNKWHQNPGSLSPRAIIASSPFDGDHAQAAENLQAGLIAGVTSREQLVKQIKSKASRN